MGMRITKKNALQKVITSLSAYSPLARDSESIEQERKDIATNRRRHQVKLSRRGRSLPYTAYPLPQAGDSLFAKLTRTANNKVIFWWLVVLPLLGMICADYVDASSNRAFFITTVVIFLIALRQTYKWLPVIRKLRQGIHGEMLVAEFLDNAFRDEIEGVVRVYHDIPQGTGNYDHVIICRKGVFLINTKAMAKNAEGDNILQYRDQKLYFKNSGKQLNYNPVSQMNQELIRFSQLLRETGCENADITGVVLFPGWEVEEDNPNSSVWVMSPKKMPARIKEEEYSLTDKQVKEFANKLSTWIRDDVDGYNVEN